MATVDHWQDIMDIVLKEAKDIHKIYSSEAQFCFLTDKRGTRHKITGDMSLDSVRALIDRVKAINSFRWK